MTLRKLFSLMLAVGIFALPVVGCGGDEEEEEGTDTEMTSETEVEESDGGDAAASMAELQKELSDVITGIETVEDAEAADEQVGDIFTRMADLIRDHHGDTSAAMAVQNDPATQEYSQKIQEHIRKVSMSDPEVGLAIGKLMGRHAIKLANAVPESFGENERKALEAAESALDDAEKALDKLGGE